MSGQILFSIEEGTEFFKDKECRVLAGKTTQDYDTPATKLVGAELLGGQLHVKVKNIGWMEARELKLATTSAAILAELMKHKADLTAGDLPAGWKNK